MTDYEWPTVDMKTLTDQRRERLMTLMHELDLDHVLLFSFDNIRWATDYRTNLTYDSTSDFFAALVDRAGESVLIAFDIESDIDEPLLAYRGSSAGLQHPPGSRSGSTRGSSVLCS